MSPPSSRPARVVSADPDLGGPFDVLYGRLDAHNHHPVVWRLCFERQCALISQALEGADVALDLGCGPAVHYAKPAGTRLIGVDSSLPSLEANGDLDVALHASATDLPLEDSSVDVVIGSYVLHHLVGDTVAGSWKNLSAAFDEIARVAAPGAEVLIMEICAWPMTWRIERRAWRSLRLAVGQRLDFLFWTERALTELGAGRFAGAALERRQFGVGAWSWLPPVIALPWLRVPRWAYPFDAVLFHWTLR